ncbi:hypothetical protein C8R42DRAFT_275596 [Lentinula raphanica]|nr:hypothetical protein C8R42DRAFT_275596 [Lentinula raphanica]
MVNCPKMTVHLHFDYFHYHLSIVLQQPLSGVIATYSAVRFGWGFLFHSTISLGPAAVSTSFSKPLNDRIINIFNITFLLSQPLPHCLQQTGRKN